MFRKSDYFILLAVMISFFISAYLWFFAQDREKAIFSVIWIPAIFGFGRYFKLAALLASAALAYAERQFTLLGSLWSWHLLLLAVVHAAIAYAFASPLVRNAVSRVFQMKSSLDGGGGSLRVCGTPQIAASARARGWKIASAHVSFGV